ncbi:hypothetical protein [Paradevosia shaoguanensis]|uniref:Uncharacterized protein n=1 Tax=Paradevosia shaoguanensis TaxID=1335043 RepID=A0AA41QJC1_9HYPH|nr:hypothetical protein [Paradevosia shaoguanensis]KFL25615.1 hypothetical protein JP74_17955 [Devosia sp. 17-2-E-8]MCF1741117.1 hypothetical protein [Paradevosia shaoguanensis]MCI0125600.1 hypothetical protein [Paradevosia shaoguanensis]
MIMHTFISRPGKRIEGYRNSSPRFIKVLAVGENARDVIEAVNAEERENVLMTGPLDPNGLQPMDEPVQGIKPHAVVVVHQQGDQDKFPFLIERTASMLSFVVLEKDGILHERDESKKVRAIRAIADLFVTTSDPAFVTELVDNLAS